MAEELPDTAEALESSATAKKLPIGWVALFVALVVWGVYYLWAYSPWLSGWTQSAEYEAAAVPSAATNITNTILFTAIPAVILVAMAVAMARRKPKKSP